MIALRQLRHGSLHHVWVKMEDQIGFFILDSGVEVPVLHRDFAEAAGLAIVAPQPGRSVSRSAVWHVQVSQIGPNRPPKMMYEGPALVGELPGVRYSGADGLMPPNLIFIDYCKVFDLQAERLTLHDPQECRRSLAGSSAIRLKRISSAPDAPISRELIEFQLDDGVYHALIDTASTVTGFDLNLVSLPIVPEQTVSVRFSDGRREHLELLEPVCLQIGGQSIRVERPVSRLVDARYESVAVFGTDILSQGRLYYVAPGEAYFEFGSDINTDAQSTCVPSGPYQ